MKASFPNVATAPVVTNPGAVSVTCNQVSDFVQVAFNDADTGDSPTIAITNGGAPNNIFTIVGTDGK